METLVAQPQVHEEFDRYLRTYNDVTTWLAETLDGSMRTPFEYQFDGQELYADDGSALGHIFEDSIRDAAVLAARDPVLAFEQRRRGHELDEYHDMLAMARGELPNTMVVISDFPPELMDAREDVGGYNISRKQTMLRVLTWQNGRLQMFSQSLDGSNRQALEAIYTQFDVTPRAGELLGQRIHADLAPDDQAYLTDRLTGVYDRSLAAQMGGAWYAGRQEVQHDTYKFVISQHQLIDYFVQAEMRGNLHNEDKYNAAALLSKRFEAYKRPEITIHEADVLIAGMGRNLEWELHAAGQEAREVGKVFSGCGSSVAAAQQLAEAGYGNMDVKDGAGSLEFTCKKGHPNRRPYGQLISRCVHCGDDVSC